MKSYKLQVSGTGTREEMAEALRLIASALDGKGEFPSQSIDIINGSEWNNDCLLSEMIETNK